MFSPLLRILKPFDTVFLVFVGSHVGFTIRVPRDSTDPRIFDTVVYNSAAGFDMASGKFVCQRPGTYLFTSTIIRNDVGGDALCDITVNGTRLLRVIAPTGYFSGTGSLVIHLSIGDEVYLSVCSSAAVHRDSSFSGVLIQPDGS